jgi:hypothetical protein
MTPSEAGERIKLLSLREAATILSDELGRPVRVAEIKYAVKEGRVRAEKGPGRWARYRIPEDEVQRILSEHRAKKLSLEEEREAQVWDLLPRGPVDIWLRPPWMRGKGRQ